MLERPADPEVLLDDGLGNAKFCRGLSKGLVSMFRCIVRELIHAQAWATICPMTGCIQAGTCLLCFASCARSLASSARAILPIT